jgi:Fe2+ transport system protein FeoA
MTLNDAEPNKTYKIKNICGIYRLRLSELGFNPGCKIMITNKSHVNLLVINCRDGQIALRKEEADCIIVEVL